jgi:hypothetical protein
VDYLAPAERFEAEVERVVERYLQVPITAARASKSLMRRAYEEPLSALAAEMPALLAECLASPEAEAAVEAWQRRRASRAKSDFQPPV